LLFFLRADLLESTDVLGMTVLVYQQKRLARIITGSIVTGVRKGTNERERIPKVSRGAARNVGQSPFGLIDRLSGENGSETN
jgi:hypothetical protein